ncbi:MAG: phage major capsid protein [Hyphomicrobiaceae bacterium]|nr:phage major capsid protein [Hyphomicrobiaceae bacterium]
MTEVTALETKAGGRADERLAFDELRQAFEAFKDTNEARLAAIEEGKSDSLLDDRLARIGQALDSQQRRLDEIVLKAARPPLGGEAARSGAALQHKGAFDAYVRKGESVGLRGLEAKALSVGSDPDGGYLVPEETERSVNRALKDISPIRAIAGVRQVSGSVYKRPFCVTGPVTGWVAETAARPQTASPTLAELAFPTMELYAMPAATPNLLEDAAVNIDEWLAEEVRIAFAEQEGTAFVSGDGVNKPKGFLAYPTVANASWSWGNVGILETGVDGGFPASDPGDVLIDLVYAVRSGYRQNAHFVMNRTTQAEIRKMKDADGAYIWQPSARPGEAPTVLGFPVAESEDMPDIATDALAVAFGDFQRGYLIVDRVGIRVLRDPYSAKPYVLFYTTKRVGGGIQDFAAIKLLKFAA